MKFLHTTLCLIAAAVIASCSSEEPAPLPNIKPTLPGNGSEPVKSVVHSGKITGCYDWKFEYSDFRLVMAKGELYNTPNVDVKYQSELVYSHDTIGIRNSGDMAMRVVLNSDKLIERLMVNKDEYRFVYSEGRLVSWEKTIKDLNFGADALHARAMIEYKDGDISKITYSENNDDPTYYTCTPSTYYNANGLLPETLSKQFGCYGFEHLYYAGLLGKPTKHLVQTIQVDYPDEAKMEDYEVSFNYSTNKNGHIELCTFLINGEAASVNYTY